MDTCHGGIQDFVNLAWHIGCEVSILSTRFCVCPIACIFIIKHKMIKILISMLLVAHTGAVDPVYCSWDVTNRAYTCDARSWYLPLTMSQFDNEPQSMILADVNGGKSWP